MGYLTVKVTRWVMILIVILLISSSFGYAEDLVERPDKFDSTYEFDEQKLSIEREKTIDAITEEFKRQVKEIELDKSAFEEEPLPANTRARTDMIDEAELGYDFGNDPGSGYALIKSNLPLIILGSTTTTVGGSSDQDWFRIPLDTDEDNDMVDNLTITINSVSRSGGWTHHEVLLLIYGLYNEEILTLRGDNYRSGETGVTFSHAFKTDTYYFGFYNTFQADSWMGDYTMTYNMTVEVESVVQDSNNQIITNAEPISGPIYNQSLDTDMDIFDWYIIDSPDPDNYTTNFSLTLEITESAPVHYDPGITPAIDFYTVVNLLIYHEDSPGHFNGVTFKANKQHKFGLNRTIEYYEYIDYERTYIGLYVQSIGRNRETGGEIGWRLGNDFLNGWAEYKISKVSAISIIPPLLDGGGVVEKVGKTYLTYLYNVTYYDDNNDPPTKITLAINDSDPVPMKKRYDNDKNYTDGCIYQYQIDGLLLGESMAHTYRFYAKDKENEALGDVNIRHFGPQVSNNLPPYIRDSAPATILLYEDSRIKYWSPNYVFEDADKDQLHFTLWDNENSAWKSVYNSENITITSLNNGSLKFKLKKNMYNRPEGSDIGSEFVLINATDTDPSNDFDPRHFVAEPWKMEVIIISVNDPPKINRSFSTLFYNSRLEIQEDTYYDQINLNDIFYDPIEYDPLEFTNLGNINLDIELQPNGMINITPDENWYGAESITFYASDGQAQVSDTLLVIVEPVNDAPILNHTTPQIAFEGKWFNYTFSGYDPADRDQLTFSIDISKKLGLAKSMYSFDKNNGKLALKAPNKAVGIFKDINVSISDGKGGVDFELVTFEIINTPDPPNPTIVSPKNHDLFLPWSKISFISSVEDADLDIPDHVEKFTYSWYSDISGLLGSDAELINKSLPQGNHIIKLEVSDEVYHRNITIQIKVLEINIVDNDEDGIFVWWETFYSLNPLDHRDANEDPDGDRFTNLEEFLGDDSVPALKAVDDDTHPWDRKDYPTKRNIIEATDTTDEGILGLGQNSEFIVFGVICIIIILALVFIVMKRMRKEPEEPEEEVPKDKVAHPPKPPAKLPKLGVGFELETTKCYRCGEAINVLNTTRPLAITCPECETRSVVY